METASARRLDKCVEMREYEVGELFAGDDVQAQTLPTVLAPQKDLLNLVSEVAIRQAMVADTARDVLGACEDALQVRLLGKHAHANMLLVSGRHCVHERQRSDEYGQFAWRRFERSMNQRW